MRRASQHLAVGLFLVALQSCSCDNGTGYVYERETTGETGNGSTNGTACSVDTECESGRCQNGVCSSGGCEEDSDCRDGEVCIFGECKPEDVFACTADLNPIIDINPADVNFGTVAIGGMETRTITIRNLGSCLLTLQAVGFSSQTPADFTCGGSACEPSTFPVRLPPNRAFTVNVTFAPTAPGNREGQLQIRSDDEEYPTQLVPLYGEYSGEPRLLVEPTILDFGFVNPAAPPPGNTATRKVRISNVGDGNAVLRITDVRLASAGITQFAFTPQIRLPDMVVTLNPTTAGATDCLTTGGCVDIDVTFTPTGFANYTNELLVSYDPAPSNGAQPFVSVPLKGYSTTPPVMQLDLMEMDFGQQAISSQPPYRTLRISNAGQTHMTVSVNLNFASSTDFSVDQPSALEVPVAPGSYTTVKVNYDPTVLGAVAGQVLVTTNDPVTYNALYGPGTMAVQLRGEGIPNMFNDILKVEMTFENGDSGFFGNDFRDVNLVLENPEGDQCTQPLYQTNPQGQITGIALDYCAQWSTNLGTARWTAIGTAREPERVIVTQVSEPTPFAPYKVQAVYEEDCAFLPTGLLASLLGFATDALVGYISGGTIDLGSGDVAAFIAANCFDHSSSNVGVTIFINGQATMNCSKSLGAKGQVRDLAIISRTNGQFTATCAP